MYALMFLEYFLPLKIFEISLFRVSTELTNTLKYSVEHMLPAKQKGVKHLQLLICAPRKYVLSCRCNLY